MGKSWGDLPLNLDTLLEAVDQMMGTPFTDGLDRALYLSEAAQWAMGYNRALDLYGPGS